jgi:hypothetical protein
MNFSITKNGKQLSSKLYNWDAKTKTLSTEEEGLVLDISGIDGATFNTGSYCTFNTGPDCTFKTGYNCTFKTGSGCTFKTGGNCTFNTGDNCTFNTGDNCVAIRYDVKGITKLTSKQVIKFNGYEIAGHTVMPQTRTITIAGKDIEISEESFKALKKQLNS